MRGTNLLCDSGNYFSIICFWTFDAREPDLSPMLVWKWISKTQVKMPPRSFPLGLRVGTDICRVSRLAHIASNANHLNLWAKKIFTRIEWPALYQRLTLGVNIAELDHNDKLRLPSIYAAVEEIADRSPQSKKLQYLAGRFVFVLLDFEYLSLTLAFQMGSEGGGNQSTSPSSTFHVRNLYYC